MLVAAVSRQLYNVAVPTQADQLICLGHELCWEVTVLQFVY